MWLFKNEIILKKKIILILFFLLIFSIVFIINYKLISIQSLVCRIDKKVTQYNKRLFNYNTLSIFRDYCYDFAKDDLEKEDKNIPIREKKILNLNDNQYFFTNFKDKNNIEWLTSHKDLNSNKYINIKNINNKNILDTKIHAEIDLERIEKKKNNIEVSPVFFENFIVFVDLANNLKLFNLETKKIIWSKNFNHLIARRNLQIIDYNNIKTVLFSSTKGVYFIDLYSGKTLKKIGNDNSLIAPIIFDQNIIIFTADSKIKKYNLNTEKIIWQLSLRKDDFLLGASPWGGVSFSKKYDKVFISVGSPRSLNDFIGINRPGLNLYSNSLVSVDLKEGKIDWWFQDVAHDLWDLDISFPPILKTVKINNRYYDVVVVVSKSGNVFVLHQKNGKSLFDYKIINTPQSEIYGEKIYPYQLETTSPPTLIRQEIKYSDLADYDDKIFSEISENFKNMYSGNFLPPKLNKDTALNGVSGGGQWYGGAIDDNDVLYVIVNSIPWLNRIDTKQLGSDGLNSKGKKMYLNYCASCHGVNKSTVIEKKNYVSQPSIAGEGVYRLNTYEKYYNKLKEHKNIKIEENIDELIEYLILSDKKMHKEKKIILEPRTRYFLDSYNNLATKAPWSKLFAIDLKKGNILWSRPAGNQEYNLTSEKKIIVEGSENWAGLAVLNNTIIVSGSYDKKIYFYDSKSGDELYNISLDGVGSAPPSIHYYRDSIYIAYVLTGGGRKYGEGSKLIITKF